MEISVEEYANQAWTDLSDNIVYTLSEIPRDDPDVVHLLTTIRKRKIPITKERKNTGVGRSTTFGVAYKKWQGHKYAPCVNNKKYPELYEAILKVAIKFCPIPFYAIQVNHNYAATPHYDKNNVGHSMIFAIGHYKGGELCARNGDNCKEFDVGYKPVIMDATAVKHWVNAVTEGDRYSFVLFTGKTINNKKLGEIKPSDFGPLVPKAEII